VNKQISVGDSKNVIVFDPLLTGHAVAAYAFSMVTNGNLRTHKSRTDRRTVFKLGSKVSAHDPPYTAIVQGQKVKSQGHKVT